MSDDLEIFKIQRPLATNAPEHPGFLIYNEDRSIQEIIPYEFLSHVWPGDRLKIYVLGRMDEKGQLFIEEVVDEQDW